MLYCVDQMESALIQIKQFTENNEQISSVFNVSNITQNIMIKTITNFWYNYALKLLLEIPSSLQVYKKTQPIHPKSLFEPTTSNVYLQ